MKKLFILLIFLFLRKTLNKINAVNNPINNQIIMSKNQCIHQAILEKFISITNGRNHQNTLLYHANNNQNKKENDTVAWSEGKLLSGTCSIIDLTKLIGLSSK